MPRPNLASIGVGYRKIPLMAIGKDIYCDSRLIISKIESLHGGSALTPPTLAEAGVRKLFENWTIDGGIFGNTVKLMPYWLENGMLSNKAFLDDRQTLMGGRRMTAEMMEAGRPEGLQNLRYAIDLLETTFLADGRQWILGTEGPSVADIDAVWPFEWLIVDNGMRGSLPGEYFGEKNYPKVYAWVHRFMAEVRKKKESCPLPQTLDGPSMSIRLLKTTSAAEHIPFNQNDPLKLQQGQEVEVYPSDYGQLGKTTGTLIGLTTDEVVIRNEHGLNVHFPRWNFTIKPTEASNKPLRLNPSLKSKPSLRLIYHPFSPFSRKAFVLAHELGLATQITLQKVVVCPIPIPGWSDNNADVAAYNPMAKIPCLVSESVPGGIFDSRIICEYLAEFASATPKKDARYWQLHTLHAVADGIMDATVLIMYEIRIRKERKIYFEEWVEGQKQKILRALDRLEDAVGKGILRDPGSGPITADEVAVAVAVASTSQLVRFLDVEWKQARPRLVEWLGKWERRDSFVKTPPLKDWVNEADTKSAFKI